MELQHLIRLFFGGGFFPYISRIHTASIGEYLQVPEMFAGQKSLSKCFGRKDICSKYIKQLGVRRLLNGTSSHHSP